MSFWHPRFMEKENARRQTLEQLHERRKQVVRLHKKAIKIMQIVSMTGLSYPVVRATIDLFLALCDVTQPRLAAAAVLAGCESDPGGILPSVLEVVAAADALA